jgi:hypothetical protein
VGHCVAEPVLHKTGKIKADVKRYDFLPVQSVIKTTAACRQINAPQFTLDFQYGRSGYAMRLLR